MDHVLVAYVRGMNPRVLQPFRIGLSLIPQRIASSRHDQGGRETSQVRSEKGRQIGAGPVGLIRCVEGPCPGHVLLFQEKPLTKGFV